MNDKVIVRVHLMNVEQQQVAAGNQTKEINSGCESCIRLLSTTPIIVKTQNH